MIASINKFHVSNNETENTSLIKRFLVKSNKAKQKERPDNKQNKAKRATRKQQFKYSDPR